jgi:phosphatidate cytidylyltransferase
MSTNLKKRVYTSLFLFLLLFLMLINNFILGYFLVVIGILSILEFFKMIMIIQKKDKIKQFFFNFMFIIYIFLICSTFLILSFSYNLKILIFITLISCIASDIGGFVFGKILKGPKLTKLSPKKTISGAIGSLVFSALILTFLIYNLNRNFNYDFILAGFIISIACQVGDLFFSFIKRRSNLKDSSNFLPGHGGILDRVDGILFGLPIGFITLLIFY